MAEWYRVTIVNLVRVLVASASKYTRSKVRKALPPEFSYIIEELIHESLTDNNTSISTLSSIPSSPPARPTTSSAPWPTSSSG